MAFGLYQDYNHSTECANAAQYTHIRFLSHANHQDWFLPSNTTTCQGEFTTPFSAVCWYFGYVRVKGSQRALRAPKRPLHALKRPPHPGRQLVNLAYARGNSPRT